MSGMSMGSTVGSDDDGGDCDVPASVEVDAAVAESSGMSRRRSCPE